MREARGMLPKVSLLVLSYNGKNITPIILESITKLDYPKNKIETIVIDNASTDGSVVLFATKYPWAKILTMEKNIAYAAFNLAVKECTGEYCFILNNDTEFDPQCLKEMVKCFEKHKHSLVVAPAVYDYDTRKLMYTEKYLSRTFYNGSNYGKLFTEEENLLHELENYTGGFLINTPFARSLPYVFDPDYFLYVEDVDFAYRLQMMGVKIHRAPRAKLYHKPGSTAKEIFNNAKLTFLVERNTAQTFIKNLELRSIILWGGYFIGVRMVNFLRHFLLLRFKNVSSMLKAWKWILSHFDLLLRKRKQAQKTRIVSDRIIFSRMMNEKRVIKYILGIK